MAGSGLDGGVARGEEAFTVLDNPFHRDQFINEIYEVRWSFGKVLFVWLNNSLIPAGSISVDAPI